VRLLVVWILVDRRSFAVLSKATRARPSGVSARVVVHRTRRPGAVPRRITSAHDSDHQQPTRTSRSRDARGQRWAWPTKRFLACERVDVQAIARELGLARATMHRWFQTREALLGELLGTLAERRLAAIRADVGGGRRAGAAADLRCVQPRGGGHSGYALPADPGARARVADPHVERRNGPSRARSRRSRRLIDQEIDAGRYQPPRRCERARIRDRASRRGLTLQRHGRRDPRRRRSPARGRGRAARRKLMTATVQNTLLPYPERSRRAPTRRRSRTS